MPVRLRLGGRGDEKRLYVAGLPLLVTPTPVPGLPDDDGGGGGNFVVVPASSSVLISGNFARSQYDIVMSEINNPDRYSKINSFNFGLDLFVRF